MLVFVSIAYAVCDVPGNILKICQQDTKCGGLKSKQWVTNPKMFATGDDRCPVRFFDLYTSKRPAELRDTGRFFPHTEEIELEMRKLVR